jgi:hypothetical protein
MSILSDVKDIEAKVREAMQNGPVTQSRLRNSRQLSPPYF